MTSYSEIKSNSSYAISAINFNSKSLNPLENMNPATIAKIKRQAENYTDCAKKCLKIWNSLAKNEMAGSNLTEKVLESIFKEYQSQLYNLTKIGSIKEFVRIFDQDHDGMLNPDEQIGIFSFIKQRLQMIANNCLQIQHYVKFESLMVEVRELEVYIAKWQDRLRDRIHLQQLDKYKEEGINKVDLFCDRFDKEFENLQQTMVQRRQAFEQKAYFEGQQLETKLGQSNQYLFIKPSNRIKQLQVQQKLVSLEQRVYEALDFRKQLNELEFSQKARVDKLMLEHANQLRENLTKKHQKQRRELQIKLREMEDKLVIRMKKEFDILRKRNNLHQIQIRRLQGLEKKWAEKKGVFEPELKRTKKLKNQRNEILEDYKKSMFGETSKLEDTVVEQGNSSKYNAKSILSGTMKFKISSKAESEQPVNTKSIKGQGNMGGKINKYITPKTMDKGYSLSRLYDNNLEVQQVKTVMSQNQINDVKNRKFNFIMGKIKQ